MTNTAVSNPFLNKLQIDTEVAELVLVKFLENEIGKAGFSQAVLGLSGGIDSALSCYLVAKALGPENVLALRLPHQASSAESLAHAGLVIEALGIRSETVEITGMVESLADASPQMTAHRKGNVMARARMTIIFDRSLRENALVIGTSNKTELMLGYGTIYGDLASAVNPIGDLYKTQVRQLSRALSVPDVIIDKAPSADLIPGQTDEDDFGFSYETVDQLLYLMLDERYSQDEAVAAGFERPFVERVLNMVQRSQYKRTMPIIPKISDRSITHDFRYLRDWGT
ncbi:NAD+ synthase [Candidatus Leptofilum sp.]|uniref:NAD+ synthase n=1 Tax=Candidatus Leptofilum sp. TaxID=3241576 RepID=UPI003B5AB8E5